MGAALVREIGTLRSLPLCKRCLPLRFTSARQATSLDMTEHRLPNDPKIAGNHIGDPGDLRRQIFLHARLRQHRDCEQIRFDRLHKIRGGVRRIAADTARLDRNIGLARRQNEFLQRRFFLGQCACGRA